ncbi:DHA2 family efflux MFS transporter permease subunit [Paenibacillus paridis]|uniref:DHA2 family efflux MFS transporter permease subunit n=1 Tax=Paenibacillus paridis TaxID=2583376 RepID=UPI0011240F69|nr:DHA2 family efflux MFS transporter permease subunit [Paenibacillus paridis]
MLKQTFAADTKSIVPANTRPGIILFITCIAVFMSGLDLFIVNVALSNIGQSIGNSSLSDLSWVLNGYAIFFAALLVPAGRMADRLGQKNSFIAGMFLFTAASLGAALSGSLWMLILFRCIQAVGAAILTPSSLGLLLASMPPERRTSSVRIWASSGSFAAALGPVIGGLLLEVSWSWIFVINLPIGLLAILAAVKYFPANQQRKDAVFPDLLGGLWLILAIGALSLGLVKGPDWGWAASETLISFAAAAVAILLYVIRSARHAAPIIDPSLLRNRVFVWSNLSVGLLSAAFAIELLSVILFLQEAWGWSALKTGLAIAPGPCMVFLFSALAQRLSKRMPAGFIAAAGALLIGIGPVLMLSAMGSASSFTGSILPGWMLIGIGYGLALPTMISSAASDLAPHLTSTGSAVVNMSRQIGTVLGTSLLVIVLTMASENSGYQSYIPVWWAAGAVSLLSVITALGISARKNSLEPKTRLG